MSKMQKFYLTKDEIRKLCEAGGMAPSGGNVQPWEVTVDNCTIELRIDPTRSGTFLDIRQYASVFALGSFTENLCITADSLGLVYDLEVFDYKDIDSSICRITFTDRKAPRDSLYQYISERVTNRQFYDGTIILPESLSQLEEVLSSDMRCELDIISALDQKRKAAEILGRADVIRTRNKELFSQMMDELRWSEKDVLETRDGIDIKTMELPGNTDKMLLLLKKFPSMGKMLPTTALRDMAKPLLIGCSHLCALSLLHSFGYPEVFLAGGVLERIWLMATKLGLSFHPWTILPFLMIRAEKFNGEGFNSEEKNEIIELGKELRELFSISRGDTPLFIFRLSKSKPPSKRALRRYWQDYTTIKR